LNRLGDYVVKRPIELEVRDTPERAPETAAETALYHLSKPEVRIVTVYFFLASLWVVSTDLVLSRAEPHNSVTIAVHSLKGLNFVITTAVLLFLVLQRAYGGWRLAEQQRLATIVRARERYRMLSSHIEMLREEDRTRIAREIHDDLGQLLTCMKMNVRLVENQLSDRDDGTLNPAIDRLVEVSELVDLTIASVQRIATGLRPSALDNLGLPTALLDEAAQFSQRSGIACALVIGEIPEPLPPEVSTTVFRIFQEALTNVARHAEAGRIDSSLSATQNALKLTIHDDGKGIDPAILDDPKSLGLIGMLERANNVGGQVTFTPHPVKGTDVILSIPLTMTETDSNPPQ
jgi:signal transduction histidine kinase